MAQQNAVIVTNQKNVQENGAVRTYIGRGDIRRRGGRPQYSGSVSLVSATEGNRVKDAKGNVHSMTLTGAMFTSTATAELYKREPDFKKNRVGQDEVWRILALFRKCSNCRRVRREALPRPC